MSATFMGVPTFDGTGDHDVVILGIPYDVATHPYRVGSRLGPRQVREQSLETRPYLSDATRTSGHGLRVADAGDVVVIPGQVDEAFGAIDSAVSVILDSAAVPVAVGGDGAVTLPQLRALARAHGPVSIVHFDAHTDCYPVPGDTPFTNATTFTHAANEGLVDVATSVHHGVRGTTYAPDIPQFAADIGYRVGTTADILEAGTTAIAHELRELVGDRPVFLSFDMDIFDPSVAPGVCTPEWGGLTAAQGIALIRGMEGVHIVGADVTTVSPPHDRSGATASLAARVLLEILHVLGGHHD